MSNIQRQENFDYTFIKESPVNRNEGKLEFGHNEIIVTLEDIVLRCATPFTIGLFGKWGSGKSSISESLRDNLKAKQIPVVIFDVWKHEGDALRRTFLRSLVEQLKGAQFGDKFFNQKYDLDERVTSTVVEANDIYKIYKRKLAYHLGVLLLFSLALIVPPLALFLLIYILFNVNIFASFGLGSVIASISGALSASFIFKYIDQFIKVTKVEARKDKFQDPYEFERAFGDILNHLKNRRILIVFDNLDRVSGENAVKIISVIKTFLEPIDTENEERDVVFMIPCDVEAIKSHLIKVFKDEVQFGQSSINYADEFLRKFFNTVVWIPEFYTIELEDFALRKLRETKIKEFEVDSLAWLITKVFRNNPRQIIQFINILVANYLLLRQKTIGGKLQDPDFYKKNVPQLAKYLLLVQKFPQVIDDMKRTRTYFLTESYLSIVRERFGEEFGSFVEETNHVNIDSFEPFFTLKVSEQEQAIPGISRLIFHLEQANYEQVFIEIKQYDLAQQSRNFNGIIRKTLEETNSPLSIVNLVKGFFLLTKNYSLVLENNTFQTIQNKLTPSVLRHFDQISPSDLTSEFLIKYKNISRQKHIEILKKWVDILGEIKDNSGNYTSTPAEYISSAFIQLCTYYEQIPAGEHLNKVRTCGTHFFGTSWEMWDQIKAKEDLVNTIVTKEWYLKLMESIPKKVDNESIQRLQNLYRLMHVFSGEALEPTIQKFVEILETESTSQSVERTKELQPLFQLLFNFVSRVIDRKLQPAANLTILAQKSVVFFKQGRWNSNYLIFPLITQLERHESSRGIVEPFKTSFLQSLSSIPIEGLDFVNSILPDEHFLKSTAYQGYFKEAVKGSPQFFALFYHKIDEDIQYDWLLTMLSNGLVERFSESLQDLNYKVPKRAFLGGEIIARLNKWTEQYRVQLLSDLDKLNLELKDIDNTALNTQVYNALVTSSSKADIISYLKKSKYLTDGDKGIINEQLFSWLKATNQIHLELMALTADLANVTNVEVKEQLKEFLFRKLVTEPNSPEVVTQGFSIIKPIIEKNDLSLISTLKGKIDQSSSNPQLQANLIVGTKDLLSTFKNTSEVKELRNWLSRFG